MTYYLLHFNHTISALHVALPQTAMSNWFVTDHLSMRKFHFFSSNSALMGNIDQMWVCIMLRTSGWAIGLFLSTVKCSVAAREGREGINVLVIRFLFPSEINWQLYNSVSCWERGGTNKLPPARQTLGRTNMTLQTITSVISGIIL